LGGMRQCTITSLKLESNCWCLMVCLLLLMLDVAHARAVGKSTAGMNPQ
jgi:hypothetical protein